MSVIKWGALTGNIAIFGGGSSLEVELKTSLFALFLLPSVLSVVSIGYCNTDFCKEFFRHGKYDQTIESCTTQINNARRKSPQSKETLANDYYYRGRSYEQKQDIDKAFADLAKAVELNGNLYQARISLGLIYLHRVQFDNALNEFNKAALSNPDDEYICAIYTNRGNVYQKMENFDSAIADYTTCLKSNPSSDSLANAYTMRGNAYMAKGDLNKALPDYDEALKLNPSFIQALFPRGVAFYRQGNYQNAISDFSNLIDLQPLGDPSVYANRGNAFKAIGQFDKAISDYKKAIELKIKYPRIYVQLASAYSLSNKLPEACDSVKKAIDAGYNDFAALKKDKSFENVRSTSCFKDLMNGK